MKGASDPEYVKRFEDSLFFDTTVDKEFDRMSRNLTEAEALGAFQKRGLFRREGFMKVSRGLLTFEFDGNCFRAATQMPFKPHGLIIWGAPPLATVELKVGNRNQVTVTHSPAPARFFAMGENFEQISKLMDEGKDPPSWCTWNACDVGNIVTAIIASNGELLGPDSGIELCMWGESIETL